MPAVANPALNILLSLCEGAHKFDRAEKVLLDQLKQPANAQQRDWLTLRLDQLYHTAIVQDGTVSLGSGQKLYQALERKLRTDMGTVDSSRAQELIHLLCNLYGTAANKKFAGVHDDFRAFARQRLPEVLKQHVSGNYQNLVNHVASSLRNIIGPRAGIEFLLDRIEHEPAWYRLAGQDGWGQHSWILAQWRMDAKDIGELENRLLPLVLAELRRDLESGQQRSRIIYARNYGNFWAEKEPAFAEVAEDVLAKRVQSGTAVQRVADYLYHGLNRYARAIEILLAAHKQKLLDETGQIQLVLFLHGQNRHAESIPLLEPLVERSPENLSYRVQLMSAYAHSNRRADLKTLLKQTDAFFHKNDRWNEGVMATLGASCLDNELYAEAAAYYNEAIPLHQRTPPRRGIGNGVLSSYYAQLARAWSGLGKTAEAVDAASGAIVSWGHAHHNRAQAIEALQQVLRESADLDGYVAALDKQTAANGTDSAIVRKALGQVYLKTAAFPKAIAQLRLAIALQPNDAESHRLLIDAINPQHDKDGVILALLDAVGVLRRDVGLYQELGRHLADQPKEAERAYTSIVEVLPSESESHAMLAEVRQGQNRWPEAIAQWEQVVRIRAWSPPAC